MSRTTIAIQTEIRDRLREFKGVERTYDDAMLELLDEAGVLEDE